ncbi:MAG: hypothetical protein IT323_20750 [Anaerolineae bacterium]|nr:hypothetical protein [Anaerolineae bacterium]
MSEQDKPEVPPATENNNGGRTGAVSIDSRGAERVIISQDPIIDEARLRSLNDPFVAILSERRSAREVIRPDDSANRGMLRRFVTPQRQAELWAQLEALQEEVVQQVQAVRKPTDAYQQDLLFATSLLLQSPANYEEARQIVYRVRADLQRERRVLADVSRYRPRLLAYNVLWLVLAFLLIGADPWFRAMIPSSIPILKMALLPMLFGILGATFNGLSALHEHTTIRRDFDPIHVSWYVLNPLGGALTGLVVFIFFVVTGSTFTPNLATQVELADAQAPLVIWLLAFIVGWQQNVLFTLLNRFLKSFAADARLNGEVRRTQTSAAASTPADSTESAGGSQVAP